MSDAAGHVVAVQDDRSELTVAEAGHLDRAVGEQLPRAGAVADGPAAGGLDGTCRKE